MTGRTSSPCRVHVALCAGIAMLLCRAAAAADGGTLWDAITGTRPLVEVRLRSEEVDQFGKVDTADAVTVRARLGFQTGAAWDTALLAEAVLLTPLESQYNSTINHQTQYPTVADPETYGLNRLQLINTSLPDTTLTIGRQRINLDDQRFIGSSNWRQLEQTFDAVRMVNTSIPRLTLDLTYADRVNRVYGKNSPVGVYRGDDYLANAGYQTPFGRLVGFAYLTHFDLSPTDSTHTYGARFTGERPVGDFKVGYSLSYAHQHQSANNPLRFQNDYYEGELSASLHGFGLSGGVEILDGNGIKGFTMPLDSPHAFQGWVNEFTMVPPNGVEDRYGGIGYAHKTLGLLDSLTAKIVYHDFKSQHLSSDYGSELDALCQASWHRLTALIEYGEYSARHFATDTRRLWFELDYSF